ncbi:MULTISPECIES: hypothetical protein [Shewanella]|uniref:Uncharacterized protein n=2 Tax=Bacteria TaxID=2 RepID=A0A5N5TV06_9GAMM|nr:MULTISPECIES: hypothetical protein [Shewanella]AYV12220.1 hypothetical protein EEY24_04600 [Shewanella algae]MBO2550838.1 hypothetical protein [Shewanella algae]MBO2559481.1 hypothetical protein [Shewanella algae]MBO2567858.1 hypothetical protein [Shewanella algae]MBO2576459.1 hypothetical protein [Shewanella algae]
MSVIHAIAAQWQKAEFAERLAATLASYQSACGLSGGATSLTTLCNLVAAISYRPDDPVFRQARIDEGTLLAVFFDCFRLLFIKEVQQQSITQAEQQILHLAPKLAAEMSVEALSESQQLLRQQLLSISRQLESLYTQRRQLSRNMG